MFFSRLDLKAFGSFTDEQLVFRQGCVNVVVGKNEAGKSTALRAIDQLLYGIDARTKYDFLHEKTDLVLGAVIGNGTDELEFVRRKRNKDPMQDRDGAVLSEGALQPFLGTSTREMFLRLFGIGYEDLVDGGNELLAGRGEMGPILFGASLGSTALGSVLRKLQGRADDLFKKSASKPLANVEIKRFSEASKAAKAAELRPAAWKLAVAAHDDAKIALTQTQERLLSERGSLEELVRIERSLPLVAQRTLCNDERDGLLAQGSVVDERFVGEYKSALEQRTESEKRHGVAERERARLASELREIDFSYDLLAQSHEITRLQEGLGAYSKSIQESGTLAVDLESNRARARALMVQAGIEADMDEVARELPAAHQIAAVREMAERYGSVEATLSALEDQRSDAKAMRESQAQRLLDAFDVDASTEALRSELNASRSQGDLAAQAASVRTKLNAAEGEGKAVLASLKLAHVSFALADAIAPPSEAVIRGMCARRQSRSSLLERLMALLHEKEYDLEDLRKELSARKLAKDLPSDNDLRRARSQRLSYWTRIRSAWLDSDDPDSSASTETSHSELAEIYEEAVDESDEIADRLGREATEVSKQAEMEAKCANLTAEVEQQKREQLSIQQEDESAMREYNALWDALLGEPPHPDATDEWFASFRRLLDGRRVVREAEQELLALQDAEHRHSTVLEELLGAIPAQPEHVDDGDCSSVGTGDAAGPSLGIRLKRLQTDAEARVRLSDERQRKHEALRTDVDERDVAIRLLEAKLQTTQKDKVALNDKWAKAMTALRLPTAASPRQATAQLGVLDQLGDVFREISDAGARERTLSREGSDYRTLVTNVLNALPLEDQPPRGRSSDDVPESVLPIVAWLAKELQQSQQANSAAASKEEERARYNMQVERALDEAKAASEVLDRVLVETGLIDLEELAGAADRSLVKMGLDKAIAEKDEALVGQAGGWTLSELLRRAGEVDSATLGARIKQCQTTAEDLESQERTETEAVVELRQQVRAYDGGDEAASFAEVAQLAAAAGAGYVEEFVRVSIAQDLLRQEIERFQAANQDPLLRLAGDRFAEITVGQYTKLVADVDEKGIPLLLAERKSGEFITPLEMSSGTCDQLYLALRLAAISSYLANNPPMPLVLDDLLVNFDEERAEAALKMLGSLATETQVILFTHHGHIAEIAKGCLEPSRLNVQVLS